MVSKSSAVLQIKIIGLLYFLVIFKCANSLLLMILFPFLVAKEHLLHDEIIFFKSSAVVKYRMFEFIFLELESPESCVYLTVVDTIRFFPQ